MKADWQGVTSKYEGVRAFTSYRLEVPGGWLYLFDHYEGPEMVFVPDPNRTTAR